MGRFKLALVPALLLVLSACYQTPVPKRTPAAPGKAHPLGLVEVTFSLGGDGKLHTSMVNLPPRGLHGQALSDIADGIQTQLFSNGYFDLSGERYLYATYRVRNADLNDNAYTTDRDNLTFMAVIASGDLQTIADTAIEKLRRFDGTDYSDDPTLRDSIARSMKPTHKMTLEADKLAVDNTHADLEAFSEAEADSIQPADPQVVSVLPYGFVTDCVAHCTSGRTLAANPDAGQYDGLVTFALKMPKQASIKDNPFQFSWVFEVVDDSTTRVTEGLAEQDTTNVQTRADALPNSLVTLLGNSETTVSGHPTTRLCRVRTAGTDPNNPEATLVDAPSPCQPGGNPPVITSFTASPVTLFDASSPHSSTLSWSATGDGTISYSLSPGIGPVDGTSYTVSPSQTTGYTLTATSYFGSDAKTVPVIVSSGPYGQIAELSHDPEGGAQFGLAVSIDGDTLAVGAPFHNTADGDEAGAVYIYTKQSGSWSYATTLTADDGAAEDNFGTALALHGTTLVVGAPGHSVDALARAGAAYVFSGSGSTWTQMQELTADDLGSSPAAADDEFGFSLDLDTSGENLVVGAHQCVGTSEINTASVALRPQEIPGNCSSTTGPGKAYVYTYSNNAWEAQAEFDPETNPDDPTARDGDDYSYSVAIENEADSSEILAVGAHGNGLHDNGDPDANIGAVYLYTRAPASTTWAYQGKLRPTDSQPADYFGRAVALSGDTLAVDSVKYYGADGHHYRSAVYVYQDTGGWTPTALHSTETKVTPGDPADNAYFGYYIALEGDTLVAGSLDQADTFLPGHSAGSVYVFTRSGTSWTQVQKLNASDEAAYDSFTRVALSGDTIVVGAPTKPSSSYQGKVYVFSASP